MVCYAPMSLIALVLAASVLTSVLVSHQARAAVNAPSPTHFCIRRKSAVNAPLTRVGLGFAIIRAI